MTPIRSTVFGGLLLLAAEVSIILGPPGWPTIVLAGAAVALLARAPRLDWISAGLLVALAIPFGRGADLYPVSVGGVALHPHDLVILLALGGALVVLVRDRDRAAIGRRLWGSGRTLTVASLAFAAVGLIAVGVGVLGGQAARDILRDSRWWFIYLAAPLALASGVRRDALLDALLLGTTAFAAVVLAALALPSIGEGLKAAAITADGGAIRMQYGNSFLLLPATACLAWRSLRRPGIVNLFALGLLVAALATSLTRISVLVTAAVVLILVVRHLAGARSERMHQRGQGFAASLLLLVVVGIGGMGGVTLLDFATFANADPNAPPVHPAERLFFQQEGSDLEAIVGSGVTGGRLATYVNAINLIVPSPLLGAGMGQQVEVQFATRPGRVFEVGRQPGVDNAFLTVGVKAGTLGIATFTMLLLLPLLALFETRRNRPRDLLDAWYLPALFGIGVLTFTQSFAVSGYGPFGLSLLLALPFLIERPHDIIRP